MTDQHLPQVVLAPEPFTPRAEVLEVPALGQKVSGLVAAAIRQGKLKADADTIRRLRVHVDGVPLPADTPEQRLAAMQYVPQPGEVINLVVVVQGGGGGGDTGKVLQTVLTVAVIALSLYVGGGAATPGFLDAAWIRAAGAATVAVGGQMAISSLMGTPETMQSSNDTSALKDGSNRYRPRAPMPLVLGRRHWTFDLSAPPFTTTIGQDVFLTLAVSPHYGRCWVGNLKIGETLLSDYPAEDIQVEYFLEPGVPRQSRLYPNSVAQENFQDKLDFTGGGVWDVHTALQSSDRLEVDIELPSGLRYNSPSSGKVRNEEVAGQIQFAEVGTENWSAATFPGHDTTRDKNGILLPPGSFYLNLKTPDPVRRTFGWTPPDATKLYKVRVRAYDRDGDFPDQGERTWTTMWTALRAIRNAPPIIDQNLATIFIRVRSTDDLNGSLPVISGEVEPIVPVYRNGNWDTEERSSNSAALMRWLLTGPAAAAPLEFPEFHSSLETTFQLIEANPSWKGGLLVTEERSQQDVMVALGKMGRFSTYWNGSKLCFVPDWVRGAPRQVFSGRNAAGYRYRRTFPKPIHAVFVEFSNLDEGSLEDELYVYADGYDASNATLIETLRIDFVCTQERAFQEGRVYLAKRLLQVEMHEWSAGLDAIATTYGDRVLVRHPATLYGLADGRVVNRFFQGALISGFRLDEAVEMEAGKTYGVDIRRGDGTVLRGVPVVNQPGETRILQFAAPRTEALSPRKGDLVVFGETGLISEDLEIVDIEPQEDMSVTFRAIPYIPDAIQEAINNPVPELPSKVTPRLRAPKPVLSSPESVDPLLGAAIKASIGHWDGTPVASFASRWRTTIVDAVDGPLATPWAALEPVSAIDGVIRTGPIRGAAHAPPDGQQVRIDIEVKTVLANGEFSEPVVLAAIPVLAQIPAPDSFTAQGVKRSRTDGSSYSAISVSATPISVGDILTLEVEVQKDDGSLWVTPTGGLIPARVAKTDVLGLDVGPPGYNVRARWIRSDNWPGPWAYEPELIIVPSLSDVSSDTVNVGGYPVADLLADLTSVQALAAATAAAVEEIEGTFDEVLEAAEQAAQSALDAAAAAGQAATSANTAQGFAEAANTSAIGAAASADDADASATASAASAATATAKATDAEQSATAAEADRLLAQTARGEAQTSATQAASSRDDAAGSAASASASATLAANSRDAAAGSASAAAGSASTATTAAGDAGTSAAAAMASQVSASTAAAGAQASKAATFPPRLDTDGSNFTTNANGAATVGGLPASRVETVAGFGLVGTASDGATIYQRAPMAFRAGRIYRARVRVEVVAPTAQNVRIFLRGTDGDYATTASPVSAFVSAAPGVVTELTLLYGNPAPSGGVLMGGNTSWVRAGAQSQGAISGGLLRVYEIHHEDVTESVAAGLSATAAATSASSASASETAAGQSATAASGSATNAATSAGQALTYSNQASSSAADAQSASVSAGVSASTARMTAIMSLPERMADVENFAGAISGRPETIGAFAFGTPRTDAVEGDVLRVEGVFNIVNRGWLKLAPGRTYRVTVRAGVVVEGVGNQTQIGFRMLAADGTSVSVTTNNRNMALADGFLDFSWERTAEQIWASWPSAVYIRAHTRPNRNSSNAHSGATTDMAFLRLEDVTESVSAANSAAAAVTQAANASASAASAQISADLAASVGMDSNPNLLPNSTFADGFTGWVAGTGWVTTSNRFGPYALTSTNGTSQVRMTPVLAAGAGQIYTLSGDFLRTATSGAVMADIEWLNSSGGLISRSTAISVTANRAFGSGRLSTTGAAPTGTASLQVRFYGSAWAGTALGVRQLKLEFGDKATTWRDDAQLSSVSAQLNITASTTADLATRMATARFEVTAAAGGNAAQLKIRADTSGSLAALVAQAIIFSNTVNGTVIKAMEIVNGSVFITGVLVIGTVGAGRIEINGPGMRIDVYDDQNRLRGRFGKLS